MKKETSITSFLRKNGYILVTAAWLLTISFIIDNYLSDTSSPKVVLKNLQSYVSANEKDFDELVADGRTVKLLLKNDYDQSVLDQLIHKSYFLYLYHRSESGLNNLLFWNNHQLEPDAVILTLPNQSGFIHQSNGYYIWRKIQLGEITALMMLPLQWDFSITNEYLKNKFATGQDLEKYFRLGETDSGFRIVSKEGQFLCSIEQISSLTTPHNNPVAAALRIISLLLVFLFLHIVATRLVQFRFRYGVLFLGTSVLLLRVLSYYFPIPLPLRQYELFNPSVYSSNFLLRSLGDLMINAVLFLWIVLFSRHYVLEKKVSIPVRSSGIKWLLVLSSIIILLTCTFVSGYVIRSLVADSQISFDVVNFFTLNGFSIAGFLVLGCLAIGYFFFTHIIIYLVQPLLPKQIMSLVLMITIVGLAWLTYRMISHDVLFELYLLIWLLIYLLLLNSKYLFFLATEIISSRLIFWLFFYSVSIAAIILNQNKNKETERVKQYAETLARKADPSSERMLNSFLIDFRNDVLAPLFSQLSDEKRNNQIKDSLLNQNFAGYLNRYDTRIYTFDATEQPLFNKDATNFNTLNTILNTQGKPTAVPDLFYYDVSYDRFTYISRKGINDSSGNLLGYVFILASPRKYKTDALYPELFLKGYNNSIENSPIYSFAVYNKLQLVTSHNEYSFPWRLKPGQVPEVDYSQHSVNGYEEIWYKAAADKVVIIARKDNSFIERITLFSYLFCSFLFVTAIFWLLNAIVRSRLRWDELKLYWMMSIRNQVHGTIILISLLSFLVVGVATVLFFIDRYHNNNKERLSQTIHVMQSEIRSSLNELSAFDDVIKIYDLGYKEKLEQVISKIAELHTVDINLYDLEGNLRVTSLPLPYNKGIVSNKMEPRAFYQLSQHKRIQYFDEEQIGSLNYLSDYVPIIDESGQAYAYLNIPYFTSQTKLRQEISNFLVAIININAFIFLIAGIVAVFIANRITQSFSFISNKMKEVNLGKRNEAIEWTNKDEIYDLVMEYNKMVAKLDDSAAAMAKSEREDAWREMARQVAHEIKNPLTPMKLSLQYLQKAIENNAENVQELSRSVAKTLVEQIDHLSHIAGDFSQFANIGNSRNEWFDLNELLNLLAQLHTASDRVDLIWEKLPHPVKLYADRTQINRLFTNLVQNALQAVPEERRGRIELQLLPFENRILVVVKDNGTGIPEEMQAKIFVPNFTTKTSGTGLGLAMCKGIVEQCKGKIWFETTINEGTHFFVEFPAEASPEASA